MTDSRRVRWNGRTLSITIAATIGLALVAAKAASPGPSLNSTSVGRAAGPYTPVPQQALSNDGVHRLLVSNDLGMHCADLDARILSILPPYNVVHAQVLTKGVKPTLLDNTAATVEYSAASNPSDPALTSAPVLTPTGGVYKMNFWSSTSGYARFYPPNILSSFFPTSPRRTNVGLPVPDIYELYLGDGKITLNQQAMPSVTQFVVDPTTHVPTTLVAKPYVANTPQLFHTYEKSLPMFSKLAFGYTANNTNWFSAEGIPISPFDDAGRENPFSLMRVTARDLAKKALVSVDTVVPVSGETNCKTCHLPAPYGNGLGTKNVTSPRIPSNDPQVAALPTWVSEEWAADVNILLLHDSMHATKLFAGYNATTGQSPKPVVCQTCHYTPALDLAQAGPQTVAGGLQQNAHQTMSRVMHNGHGNLTVNGAPLFPTMPAPNDPKRANAGPDPINAFTKSTLEATCYQCHPGKRTQCLRGVMYSVAGAVCQDCHGQMKQVGDDFSRKQPKGFIVAADFYKNAATPRVPWLNEPTCGSCHTGDATSNMTKTTGAVAAADGIRLLEAYLATDPKATPILPTNMRFAEPRVASGSATGNPQLFRLSVDKHGGIFCEGCHGATHAEWPVANANANDNVAATQIQGHAGKITECDACHTGSLGTTLAGPHGMHPVGNAGYSANWVGGHGDYAETNRASCNACHGLNGQGTVLSAVAVDRVGLRCESGSQCVNGKITLKAGYRVTCTTCHGAGGG